jgi:uncharacterized membrane protein YfhO
MSASPGRLSPGARLRANAGFRAVPVAAGAHRVELWYDPPAVRLGLALSAVTAVLTAFAGLRLRHRDR